MKNIVLIGMPGCGKSTLGRCLAERLGREITDPSGIVSSADAVSLVIPSPRFAARIYSGDLVTE